MPVVLFCETLFYLLNFQLIYQIFNGKGDFRSSREAFVIGLCRGAGSGCRFRPKLSHVARTRAQG